MTDALDRLKAILHEVGDLNRASAVLAWDQETYMPPAGVGSRASAMAALRGLAHERFVDPQVGGLLEELEARDLDPESDDGALVLVTRRDYDHSVKIPAELVAEAARASSEARPVWQLAREDSDWKLFAPYLDRNVDINRRIADALGYAERPYDALLDRGEPGMTTRQLDALFGRLREAIVPLVHEIGRRQDAVDDSCLWGDWDERAQLDFGMQVITRFGFDTERGRQDLSAHPFSIGLGAGDVRITTRVSRRSVSQAMFGTMHESGHAMYTQGHAPEFDGTPLWGGASPGVHESQSRLWENLVGRSRPMWRYFLGPLRQAFPGRLDGVDEETFYRAVNKVYPSLIRVEADEVTYNLHILLRFEIENDLLDRELKAADVPEAWNAKVEQYLGIKVPDDTQGALQDIHWSGISFGGFPGYTLGNVIGAQLMETVREAIPDLDDQIAAGEFGPLHGWLKENVWRHGRKFTPGELLHRITGRSLEAEPWISYVQHKFGEIYEIDLAAPRKH
jgi:carboxypeptidase Taq